jgi:serine/threonine protein kinase
LNEAFQAKDLFGSGVESTDNTPTIISRSPPTPLKTEEALMGTLRGRRLAHFELLDAVGIGGMAAVIRSRDTQLDRTVALKILPPEMADDTEIVRRFHQEARAAAKLDHENIARVFFCGEDQGLHFIAFEFVEGENLRTLLERRGQLPVPEAIGYILQIATGLAHAASRGVVHRDIKPSNIIITPSGRAKLVDMGLARSLEPQADGGLTQSGVTLGTFDYISPEQALEPREADIRSDIYSLGCTLYHMITGQPPVPEGTAAKKLHHHQHVDPLDPRQLNPAIPDEVAALLARMMAKDARNRYQRPEDLVQYLLAVAQKLGAAADVPDGVLFLDATLPGPPRTRPLLMVLSAMLALVVLILVLEPPSNLPPVGKPVPAVAVEGPTQSPTESAEKKEPDENPVSSGAVRTSQPPREEPDGAKPAPWSARELADALRKKSARIAITNDIALQRDELLVFDGEDLVIEAGSARRRRPIISLQYDGHAGGESWVALTVKRGKVTLKGLRFEVDAKEAAVTMAAIDRQGGEVILEDCEFVQAYPPAAGQGAVTAIRVSGPSAGDERADVTVNRCYFGGGKQAPQHALTLVGTASARLEHCAFADHAGAVFDLQAGASNSPGTEARLHLSFCSAFLTSRPIFGVDDRLAYQIEANECVFSRPESAATGQGLAALIEQIGTPNLSSRFRGRGNCYHNLEAFWVQWADQRPIDSVASLSTFIQRGFEDEHSVELPADVSPWEDLDPLRAIRDDEPRQAFRLGLAVAKRRPAPDASRLVGVNRNVWGATYDADKLPVLQRQPVEVVTRPSERIVDPTLVGTRENTFKTLRKALEDAQPGDTILIKHDGMLKVEPVQLEKAETSITIKPFPNYHPILTLARSVEADAALFRIHDGRLTLEHMEFRLAAEQTGYKAQTIVAMMGDGQCTLRDCLATLEDSHDVALSVVTLADPSTVMKMAPPSSPQQDARVQLEGCFVRGTGTAVVVRASRPFDLSLEESLIALAGSLLTMDGNGKDPGTKVQASISLRKLTTYLTDHLVLLRAIKDENKSARGLVQTRIKSATDCLFASASGKSLVHLDGVDNDDQMRKLLVWEESRNNAYSYFNQFLDQEATAGMMAPPSYGPKEWRDFTHDETVRFERARLNALPQAEVPMSRVTAADFKPRAEVNLMSYGVPIERLPKPYEGNAALTSPEGSADE